MRTVKVVFAGYLAIILVAAFSCIMYVRSHRSSERKNSVVTQKESSAADPKKAVPTREEPVLNPKPKDGVSSSTAPLSKVLPTHEELIVGAVPQDAAVSSVAPQKKNLQTQDEPIVSPKPQDVVASATPPKEDKKDDKKEPRWVVVLKDDFSDPDSVGKYYKYRDGVFEWDAKYKAMLMNSNSGSGKTEIYAAVHQSLPGDLRLRFRALRRKSAEQINVGMVMSIKGAISKENGYFVEWELGTAVIKKCNQEKKRVPAPTPSTPDRWLNLEVVKVGGHFTMLTEGKVVLDWTDETPFTTPDHDLFSLYIYADATMIDDLIIERNANDPILPLRSDPATDDNILKGKRQGVTAQEEDPF